MKTRLNKYIGDAGFCSRREADQLIVDGRVTINERVAKIGDLVAPLDQIRIDGEALTYTSNEIFIMVLNKPADVLCSFDTSRSESLAHVINYPVRLSIINRLDTETEGVLLLTNEPIYVRRWAKVEEVVEKEYYLTLNRPIDDDAILAMGKAIEEIGVGAAHSRIRVTSPLHCSIILFTTEPRVLRSIMDNLGYRILRMVRGRVGNVTAKNLEPGTYRMLSKNERAVVMAEQALAKEPPAVEKKKTNEGKTEGKRESKKEAPIPVRAPVPEKRKSASSRTPKEFIKGQDKKQKPTPKGQGIGKRIGKSRIKQSPR